MTGWVKAGDVARSGTQAREMKKVVYIGRNPGKSTSRVVEAFGGSKNIGVWGELSTSLSSLPEVRLWYARVSSDDSCVHRLLSHYTMVTVRVLVDIVHFVV